MATGDDVSWDWVLVGHVPMVEVHATFGMFAVPVTAETTIREIRQKVHEWKPEYSLEQIELVCQDHDGYDGVWVTCSRPRGDDDTVKSLWSAWDSRGRKMQVALWIKEKNEETGKWESTFWKTQLAIWEDEWTHVGVRSGRDDD